MEDNNSNAPTCPKCGSTNCTTGKRGVSIKKMFIGEMLFEENGYLYGFIGRNDDVARCQDCEHEWEI